MKITLTRAHAARRTTLASALLALVLAPQAGAAGPMAPAARVGAARVGMRVGARLALALDSVKADAIKADIFFIAADELGGRDTPSPGLRVAARFIRSRLERLGWKPGGPDGFLFPYKLRQRRLDDTACIVRVENPGGGTGAPLELRLGQDYFLPSGGDVQGLEVRGPVVFCGNSDDADFEKSEASGSWALCFDAGVELRRLRSAARKAGAIGLIVAPGPAYAGKPYAERYSSDLARMREGAVSYPSSEERTREAYPQLMLGRSGVERLLALANAPATPEPGAKLALTLGETRKLEGDGGMIEVENVCGFWPGEDALLSKEVIIVSAHYDHIGTRNGVVHNGADDNGTGTCGLLAVAEALTHYGPLRRSVLLIWVSGEEKGLWGSKAWVENPWLPEGCRAIANINIDMVGRNEPDKLLITPTRERAQDYNGLVRLAESLAPQEGFPTLGSADDYYTRSDHANFAKLGIPVTFLFSGVHEDYHKSGDDPEKVDPDKVRRVMRLVVRMLDGLQADRLEL